MKRIKPIDIDLHLKYICPHCHSICWLSLKETQIPKFIVVCDVCNESFKVKTIDKVSIKYKTKQESKKTTKNIVLDESIKNKSIDALVNYGFTQKEASELIQETFDVFKSNDIGTLVKESLKLFGVKNG